MRRMIAILIAATMVLTSAPNAHAEMTTEQEALSIAANYVSLVLLNEGDWGGFDTAEIASIREFTRGERTLGYFCPVYPRGFLVVSLHKELAPVKAYSVWSDLDPEADEGLTDLLKDRIERVLDAVESRLGREIRPNDRFDDFLEINYRSAWEALTAEDFNPDDYREPMRARATGMNYREGEIMLSLHWHQQPPYNDDCPDEDCSWPQYDNFNQNTAVGCVATAAAQIMRYWCWPPYGEGGSPYTDAYDWPNMCSEYNWHADSGWFRDENNVPVTWAQINAVAELSYEVGRAARMDWGCEGSGAYMSDMRSAYDSRFRYPNCDLEYRDDHSAAGWWEIIQDNLNLNCPLQYAIPDHSIVCDGWKEEWIGGDYYWYHMNYGWTNNGFDTWYALDELHGGSPHDELVIRSIRPFPPINPLTGHFPLEPFPYRYFVQDCVGFDATIEAGHYLQILRPGFVLRHTGIMPEPVTFYGEASANTVFFFHGDPDGQTRIRISGGALQLLEGAEMVIH